MPYKDPAARKTYAHDHYVSNKAAYLLSNNKRRSRLKEQIEELKSSTPCKDCGASYPYYVMDFDHLFDKQGLIIKFVRNNNPTGLSEEIKKCDIVCSNCHRIRTFKRLAEKK